MAAVTIPVILEPKKKKLVTISTFSSSICQEIMGPHAIILDFLIFWPPHVKSWLVGKDPDAGGLRARGEGDDRGWDGWMASLARWTWVWVNSRSWWWTGRPGVLWFMGSQRVGHDWATELNWTPTSDALISEPWLNFLKIRKQAGQIF